MEGKSSRGVWFMAFCLAFRMSFGLLVDQTVKKVFGKWLLSQLKVSWL